MNECSNKFSGGNSVFLWLVSIYNLVFKVVAKLTYLVIMGGHVTARLPPIIRFMIKQNCIWSKALINLSPPYGIVFCLINRRIISVKISLFFQRIVFVAGFPGNFFCYQHFKQVTNGIFRWKICYLPLLISNPEIGNLFVLFTTSYTLKFKAKP